MHRIILVVILVATAALASTGAVSNRAVAQSNTPAATPMPPSQDMEAFCLVAADPGTPTPGADWQEADVRPPGPDEAVVVPAAEQLTGEPDPQRQLYLVVITLPVGGCMPAEAGGNQKDGAIVMIVQQGIVEFVWEPAFSGTSPVIRQGDTDYSDPNPVPEGTPRVLYPGDWITLDQQATFAYRNLSAEPAIILKAVWAASNDEAGSSGGHK